jgi:membrane carboxypeptidase/penicillin-binding protein
VLGLGFGLVTFYAVWAQTFDMKHVGRCRSGTPASTSTARSKAGVAGANRLIDPINEVSPLFIDAPCSRAKTRASTKHGGLENMRGLLRAIFRNVSSGSVKEGASNDHAAAWRGTASRSATKPAPQDARGECRAAHRAAVHKEQILEAYVNRILLGSGITGRRDGLAGVLTARPRRP